MKNKNGIANIIIIGFSIILVALFMSIGNINKKTDKIDRQIKEIYLPEKRSFIERITPEKVQEKQDEVTEDIQAKLRGSEVLNYATEDGERFLNGLFIVTSQTAPDKDASMEEKQDFYKPFSFTLSNVGVSGMGGDKYQLIGEIEIKYNEKMVYKKLVSINIKNGLITGGTLYGEA